MDKLKNSLLLGLVLGLGSSFILLLLLDLSLFLLRPVLQQKILDADVAFAISILLSLLLARMFFRKEDKHELGKGFIFSSFIWGAMYVFLFHIKHYTYIFFKA
jgi:hypothetical protein